MVEPCKHTNLQKLVTKDHNLCDFIYILHRQLEIESEWFLDLGCWGNVGIARCI